MTADEYRNQINLLLGELNEGPIWLVDALQIPRKNKQNVYNWLNRGQSPRDESLWDKMLSALEEEAARRELTRSERRQPSLPETKELLGDPMIPVGYKMFKMPFAGLVPAGEWGDPLASEDFIDVEYRYEHPRRFACKVIGDSCWPALQPGDLTIWHQDIAPPYGVIVLAQRKGDHGCTVKELVYDAERKRPVLNPINDTYGEPEDGEGWGIIARLVAVERMEDGVMRNWYSAPGMRRKSLDK